MLRPFRWKVLEHCAKVYIKKLLKCISVFQHCRLCGSGGARAHHLSLMPVDNRYQHSTLRLSCSPPPPSTYKEWPTCTEKIQRRRHIGLINRCIVSNHRAVEVAHSQALQYNMLAQNCYSSWFDIPVAFALFSFLVGWLDAVRHWNFSRPPRSLVRSPRPWGVSLSGLQMIHK